MISNPLADVLERISSAYLLEERIYAEAVPVSPFLLGVSLGLAVAFNVAHQLLAAYGGEDTVAPTVLYLFPFLGSALSYSIDPLRFLSSCRKAYGDVFTFVLFGKHVTFITLRNAEALIEAGYAEPGSIVGDTGDAYIRLSGYPEPNELEVCSTHTSSQLQTIMFRLREDVTVRIPSLRKHSDRRARWVVVQPGGRFLMASPAVELNRKLANWCKSAMGRRQWKQTPYERFDDKKSPFGRDQPIV